MSCRMEPLVAAHRDGRLAAGEAESLERHVRACRSCRDLRRDMGRLEQVGRRAFELPEPSRLDRRRGRLEVLRAAAAARPTATPRSARGVWLAAAAAAAMSVVLGVELATDRIASSPPPQRLDVGLAPSLPILEAVRVQVLPGERADYAREVAFDRGLRVERLRLWDGSVDVAVDALRADQRFIVVTTDAEVEVRGTRFSVRAEAGALHGVSVREGRVEVRRGDQHRRLSAGDAWQPRRETTTSEGTLPDRVPRDRMTRGSVPADEANVAVAPVGKVAPPTRPDPPPASAAFAAAMAELEAGNYGEAGDSLQRFVAGHADDPRAEDAAFLVIVAMLRAGRHAEAAVAARAYLGRFPHGARRAEASAIANRREKTAPRATE